MFGSSFEQVSVKDIIERIGKNLKVGWILGDIGIVITLNYYLYSYILWQNLVRVCMCLCVCVSHSVENLRVYVLNSPRGGTVLSRVVRFSQGWYNSPRGGTILPGVVRR